LKNFKIAGANMSLTNVFDIAASGMSAQTVRLNAISSNIANADSAASSAEAAYKSRQPVFELIRQQANEMGMQDNLNNGYGVQVKEIVESKAPAQMRYEPENPLADENGYVHYPDINIVEEMANMMAASRAFQTNVDMMDTAKSMMQRVLALGQ
jgi:flagellar basal-body rod protein FlgC